LICLVVLAAYWNLLVLSTTGPEAKAAGGELPEFRFSAGQFTSDSARAGPCDHAAYSKILFEHQLSSLDKITQQKQLVMTHIPGVRRMAAALAALITTIAYALPATAQPTYPSKPIRFILPNAPGGSNDVVARLVGEKLTASWDQPVVIDSRPGGNNVIAAEALLKSTPDGHTILLITAAHAINPLLFPKMPYDAIKDFSAVATLVKTEYILVVNAAVPATNLREFIALAKARPGQLNAAGSNTGGIQHLALELFNMLAGVKLQHVPYKGGGPGMIDLVGGQVQAAFNNAISVMPHVRTGKIRALGVGGDSRVSVLPGIPTFAEAGLPGFNASNWFGVVMPARAQRTPLQKLANEIARIQSLADFREKLALQGVEPFVSGPDVFAAFIKTEMAKYARIIKSANIRIEH
jgi:tripartite-type tricarboxylate transporter receptor subunit TctC